MHTLKDIKTKVKQLGFNKKLAGLSNNEYVYELNTTSVDSDYVWLEILDNHIEVDYLPGEAKSYTFDEFISLSIVEWTSKMEKLAEMINAATRLRKNLDTELAFLLDQSRQIF